MAQSRETHPSRAASRWMAFSIVVLFLLLATGVLGLLWNRYQGIAMMITSTATSTWTVVPPSAAGFGTYPDLVTEWNTSPHRCIGGVFIDTLPGGETAAEMDGLSRACAGDPTMVVVIWRPSARTSPSVSRSIGMIIELHALTQNSGGILLPQQGSVAVRSELTPAQAATVMASDVPTCLINALVTRAHSLGWQPPPSPVTGGTAPPIVLVDPAPCLDISGSAAPPNRP